MSSTTLHPKNLQTPGKIAGKNKLYECLLAKKKRGQKSLAVLLDPDNLSAAQCQYLLSLTKNTAVDYFFIGGSLIVKNNQAELLTLLKSATDIPLVLFPSNSLHIDAQADAILFLSLVSGRNPEFLIGQHVLAAPALKASGLEVLPTGYMLIDSGRPTTASYMSGTLPIPHNKPAIAASTAMAAELLGLKLVYLDGGSGASYPVSAAMIQAVSESVEVPVIVGGGITTTQQASELLTAGADIIVVGNEIERNPDFLSAVAGLVAFHNQNLE